MKIVLASGNAGKIAELQQLLQQHNIEIIAQTDLGVSDAEETGLSFVENAILKARHACQETGLPAIADDSGLAVDALLGAPGIYSARYSGPNANAQSNIVKLLDAMKNVPEAERTAAFYCVLVYMRTATDPTPIICQGTWKGFILSAQQGNHGFGYDPVFYVPELQKTAAELEPVLKNRISHRGKALALLMEQLYASTISQEPHQNLR